MTALRAAFIVLRYLFVVFAGAAGVITFLMADTGRSGATLVLVLGAVALGCARICAACNQHLAGR